MGNMSLKKLTGICFIVGVLANTLPFILTIFAGATPEEGVNIFQFFSGETIKYGTAGHAYSLISVIGLALVSFSVLMLREIMQGDGKDDNPLMRLGAYLFFVASIGFMASWSLDNAMAWDSSGEVAKNFMKLEMGLFFTFGVLYAAGGAIVAFCLVNSSYVHDMFAKVFSAYNAILFLVQINTLMTVDPNSFASIMPIFMMYGIGNLLSLAFFIPLGLKLMK